MAAGWKPGDTRVGGDVGRRRAGQRRRRSARVERRLRRDGDADDAGRCDGRQRAHQRAARRADVPRRGHAVAAARAGRVRAARRRARGPGVDSVTRDRAADDSAGARRDRAPCSCAAARRPATRRCRPPTCGSGGTSRSASRFRRTSERSGDRAAARSHRQAARGAGDGCGARRRRRLAVGDGAARTGAARAGRLRDRDHGRGGWAGGSGGGWVMGLAVRVGRVGRLASGG